MTGLSNRVQPVRPSAATTSASLVKVPKKVATMRILSRFAAMEHGVSKTVQTICPSVLTASAKMAAKMAAPCVPAPRLIKFVPTACGRIHIRPVRIICPSVRVTNVVPNVMKENMNVFPMKRIASAKMDAGLFLKLVKNLHPIVFPIQGNVSRNARRMIVAVLKKMDIQTMKNAKMAGAFLVFVQPPHRIAMQTMNAQSAK